MFANVGLYSYLASVLSYTVLTLLLIGSWRGRPLGILLIAASALTAIWAGTIAFGTLLEYPPVTGITLAELARNVGWLYFLVQLITLRFNGGDETPALSYRATFGIAVGVALIILLVIPWLSGLLSLDTQFLAGINFAVWLAMAVLGLLLLEQLFRSANERERWTLKYLCLGLGGIFAFDFFMYAEALLFRNLDPLLWQARGLVTALATPLLAVSIARNSETNFDIHVSRKVVFHSVTLLGAGAYLIIMALVGYSIRFMNATWSSVLQVSFLAAAVALLIALLFSGKIRAQTRVFLSKHFFSYKYDYREEWLKFTDTLANIDDQVPEGIIRAMANLVASPAGALWASSDGERHVLLARWQMPEPENPTELGNLPEWLVESGWVIDLDEYRDEPGVYGNLEIPEWLQATGEARLIVPLLFRGELTGILVLRGSVLHSSINWEDRDLLKTAGRQAASHLSQFMASQDLVEARQFEAFNRLSAYVIHDLKNILAQQSLMLTNAQKHKHKPEFVDDMIATVSNSVDRMTKLMQQMRSGVRGQGVEEVKLDALLSNVVADHQNRLPRPQLALPRARLLVVADSNRLKTVFSHIIQNAQEATAKTGHVKVNLLAESGLARVEVTDDGCGMDSEFLRTRLFKPFESTKGLAGMGIGAFESREFIRSLGGDITVTSTPGKGSVFSVVIPCQHAAEAETS